VVLFVTFINDQINVPALHTLGHVGIFMLLHIVASCIHTFFSMYTTMLSLPVVQNSNNKKMKKL